MRHTLTLAFRIVFVVCLTVAATSAQAIPAWQPNTTYATGALVTFNAQEFKCIQGHTSQVGWEPPNVPALWQPVNAGSPDFSISATPASQSITAGSTTSYNLSVTSLNGFSSAISLSASGLPSGVTASFNPSSVKGSGSSILTLSTTNSTPASSFTLTVTGTSGSLSHAVSVLLSVSNATSPATTTGTVHFHLLLGVGNAQDSLTLDGDNFTDLIMSNMIAGVMYGHLVQEYAPIPGIQFNKDYFYGSIMAQLLQENIATQDYQSSSNLIDPSPDQQAVMGTGQGGPYQINNYAVDLVGGGTAPAGHSLINYIAN